MGITPTTSREILDQDISFQLTPPFLPPISENKGGHPGLDIWGHFMTLFSTKTTLEKYKTQKKNRAAALYLGYKQYVFMQKPSKIF